MARNTTPWWLDDDRLETLADKYQAAMQRERLLREELNKVEFDRALLLEECNRHRLHHGMEPRE